MKKLLILLFLLCATFGCIQNSADLETPDEAFWRKVKNAPYIEIPKKDLPEWLVFKINNEIEASSPLFSKVQIFVCVWKFRPVFFILDPFNSCMFCDVYYKSGKRIEWASTEMAENFCLKSENWILIYEYDDN